jgi:5-carboxymethyl-2-hydroxymuconate isomerase
MKLSHVAAHNRPTLYAESLEGGFIVPEVLAGAPVTLDELIPVASLWLPKISEALRGGGHTVSKPPTVLAPFASTPTVIAIGLNYSDHCREFGVDPPTSPVVFTKKASSIIADGEPIRWKRSVTDKVDWEAELGVIIGETTREVSPEDALAAVFGYTVINDVTARDIQTTEQQWVRGKSLDTFCPLGPVVVTADDIPDPQNLAISSLVNGEIMQQSNTSEMIFSVAELISRLSHSFTLVPGDIIATGTPLGVGAFRTPPRFLGEGDVIEVAVEGIGSLVNICHIEKEG